MGQSHIASHSAIHSVIHSASSGTTASSVNYEVDHLEREGIWTATKLGHCEGYCGRHCREHCGEGNRVAWHGY